MSLVADDGAVTRRTVLLGGAGIVVAAGTVGFVKERNTPTLRRLLGGCGDTPAVPRSSYRVTSHTIESAAMGEELSYTTALPTGVDAGRVGLPLVIVLPGLNGGSNDLDRGLGVAGFATAAQTPLAFLQPGGGDKSYWHPRRDGRDPLRYLFDELIPRVEHELGVGGTSRLRGALGWSMGGFGALLLAQQRPDVVSAAVGLSPAVFPSYDAARSRHPYTFDSASDWERYGLWNHLGDLRATPTFVECGDADPFAPTARELLKRIPGVSGGIHGGCHDGGFWRRRMPGALRFLSSHLG